MSSWWRHRWHLKVLALVLASAIWLAVTGEGRGVQDFRVPVDVVLGTNATIAGSPPTNVTVRLRGPDSLLRRVDPYDLTIRVDLRDTAGGERTVQLNPRNVAGVPADVEVALIEPDRLRLTVAKKKRREVTVVPDDRREAAARLSGLPRLGTPRGPLRRRARIEDRELDPARHRPDPHLRSVRAVHRARRARSPTHRT
jgi:YbbR domain-containing protein